ncbi:MAG: PfkB family carbohydrate kinase [Pseudomonadota bacterium]
MSAGTASVLCVGVAVYDQIFALPEFPATPTKVFCTAFASAAGGPAANAAVTVARQGGRATLWARVGADAQGARIVQELGEAGVDVSAVRRVEGGRSGTSAVAINDAGERLILAFADPLLDRDASWLPLSQVASHDAVLCDVRWPAATRAVLAAARNAGVPSVLDADLTSDGTLAEFVPLAQQVVFSMPALEKLRPGAGKDLHRALAELWRPDIHTLLAVTLGEQGCVWYDGHVSRALPGVDVQVVDTLAAGDTFHGAFALAIARRQHPAEALDFANRVAALKCTRWGGGTGIPTADELDRFQPRYRTAVDLSCDAPV